MIADVLTMLWKERRDLLREEEGIKGTLTSLIYPAISMSFIGIFLPIRIGDPWVEGYASVLISAFVSLFVTGMVTADAVAGERERKTLATLLASRLSDRAILAGKLASVILFGLAMAAIVHIISLIAVNAAHWTGGIALYGPLVILANVLVCVLAGLLTATVGVLVGIRSPTVMRASQTIMTVLFAPVLLLGITLFLLLEAAPPGWRERVEAIIEMIATADPSTALLVALGGLALLDSLLLLIVLRRFRRTRLLLD